MAVDSAPRFLDSRTHPHILTLTVVSGVAALTMNIFLPSLPAMTEYFHTDYRLMQLSVALFLAVNAVLQVVVGPISDRYGRRPLAMWCFGLFLVATLGCIYAPDVHTFLAFRMAQAIVVGALVLARAAIRDMVPGDRAASMIGYVTMGMSLVPMVGPAIGGVLDQTFGWKANFWLQAILGLLTLWLIWQDMGETAPKREGGFAEQIRQYPGLLASPRFWGYCGAAAFASGTFFAYLGGAPYVASEVYGLDPAHMGFFFGLTALGYLIGNFLSGRFSVRVGMNRMVLWGSLVTTAGLVAALGVFLAGLGSHYVFFGFMIIVGIGNGMVLPNANAGILSVRPELAGSASGLGGAMMIGGGAALSAFAGAMLAPGTGAFTLLLIMCSSSLLSVACILFVIRRARRLGP